MAYTQWHYIPFAGLEKSFFMNTVCFMHFFSPAFPLQARSDTRSVFKWKTTSLNAEFFPFTTMDALPPRLKNTNLFYYLPMDKWRRDRSCFSHTPQC